MYLGGKHEFFDISQNTLQRTTECNPSSYPTMSDDSFCYQQIFKTKIHGISTAYCIISEHYFYPLALGMPVLQCFLPNLAWPLLQIMNCHLLEQLAFKDKDAMCNLNTESKI